MKKQVIKSISAYNYLHEISAIPEEIRSKYLNKLLRRKNSEGQKNIKLLKIIYTCIDRSKFSSWNANVICRKLGISMEMLYYHKSKLLKGLREYFLKCNQHTRKLEEKNDNYLEEISPKLQNKVMELRKMVEIGMFEEAKNLSKKLIIEFTSGVKRPESKLLFLSEFYENIILHYFNRRKRKMILHYLKEFDESVSSLKIVSLGLSEEELAIVDMRLKYSLYYLFCLEWYKDNLKVKGMRELLSDIYMKSKKINETGYLLRVLHHKAIVEITSGRMSEALKICKEGAKICREHRKETEFYTFASMLLFLKIKIADSTFKGRHDKIIKYYKRVKTNYPLSLWTLYLENACAKAYYPEKDADLLKIFQEQVNSNILIGDFSFSTYWKFVLDSEMYMNEILGFFKNDGRGYIEHTTVNEKLLEKIDELCLNTLRYHKELNDLGFLRDVYLLKLEVLFFKERNFDYDLALIVINKIDWLIKNRKKMEGSGTFNLLKLSLKMIEYLGTKSHLTRNHYFELGLVIKNFKKTSDFNIIDYAILSSLARRLKSKEVSEMVKDFYEWIESRHPEIIKPVMAEMEKRKSKIHTISAENAA